MELDERKKVIIKKIPDIHIDEILMIVRVTMDFELEKIDDFLLLYTARRKKPEIFRQYTLLGFIGIGGIQKFYLELQLIYQIIRKQL